MESPWGSLAEIPSLVFPEITLPDPLAVDPIEFPPPEVESR